MKALSLQSTPPLPPVHVAIIMDGNGRWAESRGLKRIVGHRAGAATVKRVIKCAIKTGVDYLTLYGFSLENWKRPSGEINDLMGLLRFYLRSEIASLHKNAIRFRVIGDRQRLDRDIVTLIDEAEKLTAGNGALNLTVALSYGGRAEITMAARKLAEKVAAGSLRPADVDEAAVMGELFTRDIPDPDLLIRTSGEKRISNFLLWQLAYAEFVFVDTLWPDFTEDDFLNAVSEFQRRDRRYGAICG